MKPMDTNGDALEPINAERWLERLAAGETPRDGWEPVCRDLLLAYSRLQREHSRVMSQMVRILRIVSPEFGDPR
ncbi:hypothetical protein [Azospirillum canadense]|uniref:hypothetical protein n=1 Tax=Azospirillum canadense TaxID=403962 RepID=UPI002226FE00|nr:hypothetical protein [Azospirillum canadense]MCW2243249.1 hypothetical protein [Azospirillum canadense]